MLVETHFIANRNHFFHCLTYFSRGCLSRLVGTHFSVEKKKYCFSLKTFFPAGGNHYSNHKNAYLKLLSLLFPTIYYDFSDISANVNSFLSPFLLVETNFMPTWNSALSFGDFALLMVIKYLKNNLIPLSGNWFYG